MADHCTNATAAQPGEMATPAGETRRPGCAWGPKNASRCAENEGQEVKRHKEKLLSCDIGPYFKSPVVCLEKLVIFITLRDGKCLIVLISILVN